MSNDNNYSAAVFWGIVAAGVATVGLLVAIFAGYLLGHYTHERTKTVAERTVTVGGGGSSGSEDLQIASPVALSAKAPNLVSIGSGVDGPSGLSATVWANGPKESGDMAEGPNGTLFVSTAGETGMPVDGVYALGKGTMPVKVISGLYATLGLAWYHETLYVSSYGRVETYSGYTGTSFTSHKTILQGLPGGKLGWNDNLRIGPEGRFYMGIASGCDHCAPTKPLTATIVSFKPDGSDLQVFASGVRGNSSLAFEPGTDELFMVTNQRNEVEGKTPHDQFGLVQRGSFWGYPWCWQQGGVECQGVAHPLTFDDIHGASDGLAFINGSWGASYGLSAIGSEWLPGKVLRFAISQKDGTVSAQPSVLLTGIQNPGPLLTLPGGGLLVSSYATGTIYEIQPASGGSESSSSEVGGTETSSTQAAGSSSASPSAVSASGRISSATISGLGSVLVNGQGRTLYIFVPDSQADLCEQLCRAVAAGQAHERAEGSGRRRSEGLAAGHGPRSRRRSDRHLCGLAALHLCGGLELGHCQRAGAERERWAVVRDLALGQAD
jgi:glucose/arabinose dehydrogenase